MKLRFVWWNAGLSVRGDASDDQVAVAADVIRALLRVEGCALVALCEVKPAVLGRLAPAVLREPGLTLLAGQSDPARPHDLAVIFDPELVEAAVAEAVYARSAGDRTYAGLIFELAPPVGEAFKLVLCHWPAVGMGDQDHAEDMRIESAFSLRAALDCGGALGEAVVLGDFNDEPFHGSLRTLRGTRDIRQVRKRTDLLYNTAWRWLGAQRPFDGRRFEPSPAGTYWLRSGRESSWRTFDQVLVSRSFVEGTGWTLREDETRLWDGPELRGIRGGYLHPEIDHLPVVVTLEYIAPTDADARDDDE